jgi:hypothetical protein
MTAAIRGSDVFLGEDLRRMLAALEIAEPGYKPAFDTLRVALGLAQPPALYVDASRRASYTYLEAQR